MLDMFELDGGLKAQSLCKVVFSEMRDSQNSFDLQRGLNSQSLWKVGCICFLGSGNTTKFVFPYENQHFQGDTYTKP